MARRMRKMARKMEKQPENGSKMEFGPIFPIFRPMFPPFFRRGQNPVFGHFRPHSGRRPEMDLYQVHEIPSLELLT